MNVPESQFRWRTAAYNLLTALGSLRLTVFLLSLGLVLILIATLQQTRHDIYQVKQQHYSAPLVYIPFQELIIPAWFPETQSVGGGFMMPSGVTVLVAMLVNLVCAHLVRFRVQASGRRLAVGLGVLALGAVTTLLVIMNGNSSGFQETPLIPWETQWTLLQTGLGVVGIAGIAGAFALAGTIRRIFAGLTGAGMLGLLFFLLYLGESSFIGDDAMRVLWRLIQGGVAAVVCYLGAVLLFRRKAGIVIIHSGLLLLMAGELYTTWSAVEQQMFFYEGETSFHTVNYDETEVAFLTPETDGRQNVIAINTDALQVGEILDDPRLPVRVRPLALYSNSSIERKSPDDPAIQGEQGLARIVRASGQPPVPGTDSRRRNTVSGYLELLRRDRDESLGVFLASQQLYENDQVDLDQFETDGQTWQIALRQEHYYKPYSVQLESTTRTNYLGTEIPQTYSSTFRIIDPENGVDDLKKVSMNRPLRYNNETFYQSQHGTDIDGRKFSVLQIVRNTGWLIPYVSCAFVGIGLLMHFLAIFVRFAEKLTPPASRYDGLSWAFVIGALLIFGFWTWREIRPERVEYLSMNLTEFGRLPVVSGGRVQPLDSLARTTLRESRKRETVPDAGGVERPAIRWLADWVFDEPGADQYLVFKIDDPDIIAALDLVRRKRNLYSWAEIMAARDEFERMVREAGAVAEANESELTPFQRRILNLNSHVRAINNLRYALSSPAHFGFSDPTEALAVSRQMESATGVVKAVPGESADDWTILSPLKTRYWLADTARAESLETPRQLAQWLMQGEPLERLEDRIFREELMIDVARRLGMNLRELDLDKLQLIVDEILADPDPQTRDGLRVRREQVQPNIDAQMEIQQPRLVAVIADEIARILPVTADGQFDWQSLPDPPPLVQLDALWTARDAAGFNEQVQQQSAAAGLVPDLQKYQGRVQAEFFHNQAAPFYVATAIYIAALILTLISWVSMVGAQHIPSFVPLANGTRRAAFWLMVLAFIIHTVGLVLRIYISGRPPVTNLYSSAIFIGWAAALLGMLVERFAGHSFGTLLSCVAGWLTLAVAFDLAIDGDTFTVLQAVLDTQFWLSTHVVTITLGYAATFVAGSLGVLYMLITVLAPGNMKKTRDMLIRLVYGVTCFALLCSFVGTVLGGLWADDSWGRFWGWDPKENGALMIVLANALLLHARWGGLVRARGIAMLAIFGNMVTIWSWFAVNELGVGLHAYGVSEDRMKMVSLAWVVHLAILSLGWIPQRFWVCNWRPGSPPATD